MTDYAPLPCNYRDRYGIALAPGRRRRLPTHAENLRYDDGALAGRSTIGFDQCCRAQPV